MGYIHTPSLWLVDRHHYSKPFNALLTNIISRFHLDPALKSFVAEEVKSVAGKLTNTAENFLIMLNTLMDVDNDQVESWRVAFVHEVSFAALAAPPKQLVVHIEMHAQ